jgi:hypothetical protein
MPPSVPENPTEDDIRRILELMTVVYTDVGSLAGMRVRVIWTDKLDAAFAEALLA